MSKELLGNVSEYEILYSKKPNEKLNIESSEVLNIALRRMEDSYFKEQLDALLKHTSSVMTEGDIILSCMIFESLKVMCFLDSTSLGNHEIDAICSNMKKRIKSLNQKKKVLGLKKDDTAFIEQMISDFESEMGRLNAKRPKRDVVGIKDEVIKKKVEKRPKVDKPKKVSKPQVKKEKLEDKKIGFIESIAIKDMKRACIIKTKDKAYLGKIENINGYFYDNVDDSLVMIKDLDESLVFYMTTDLLIEYDLSELSEEDKDNIKEYYEFMKMIFTTKMNTFSDVSEYTTFMEYYNSLISIIISSEDRKNSKDYSYLVLAKKIYSMLEFYGFHYYSSCDRIFELIVMGETTLLLERLEELKRTCFVEYSAAREVEVMINTLNPARQVKSQTKANKSFVLELYDLKEELVDRAIFSNLISATREYELRSDIHKRLLLRTKDEDIELIKT